MCVCVKYHFVSRFKGLIFKKISLGLLSKGLDERIMSLKWKVRESVCMCMNESVRVSVCACAHVWVHVCMREEKERERERERGRAGHQL